MARRGETFIKSLCLSFSAASLMIGGLPESGMAQQASTFAITNIPPTELIPRGEVLRRQTSSKRRNLPGLSFLH